MKRNLLLTSAATGVIITGLGLGVAHAATTNTTSQNPSDRIARYTLEDERLNAVAKVLGMTPLQLEDKLKTETMKQVISDAGLTQDTFQQKVRAQVQSDLLAKGYTQAQIDNTMNHHKGMGGHMRMKQDNDND